MTLKYLANGIVMAIYLEVMFGAAIPGVTEVRKTGKLESPYGVSGDRMRARLAVLHNIPNLIVALGL